MKFDYYLFDLDNCLLHNPDPNEYFDAILIKTLKRLSIKIPERNERRELFYAGEGCSFILENWGVSKPQDFWQLFDNIDFESRKILVEKKEIYLYRDVEYVLQKLLDLNKKTAIISNSPNYIIDYIIDKFNLARFFNEILSVDYTKNSNIAKPSPEGVLFVLEKLNYNPRIFKALMIGDSIIDVIAAKKANIHACLIKRDSEKKKEENKDWEYQPDCIIENLYELLDL